MPSLECWKSAREHEYYKTVIQPDEEYFADMARSRILVGWEEVYIQHGEVTGGITGEGEKRAVREEKARQREEEEEK